MCDIIFSDFSGLGIFRFCAFRAFSDQMGNTEPVLWGDSVSGALSLAPRFSSLVIFRPEAFFPLAFGGFVTFRVFASAILGGGNLCA